MSLSVVVHYSFQEKRGSVRKQTVVGEAWLLNSCRFVSGALQGCAKNFYNLATRFEILFKTQEKINETDVVHHVRFKLVNREEGREGTVKDSA